MAERADLVRDRLGVLESFPEAVCEEWVRSLTVYAAQPIAQLKIAQARLGFFRHQPIQFINDVELLVAPQGVRSHGPIRP